MSASHSKPLLAVHINMFGVTVLVFVTLKRKVAVFRIYDVITEKTPFFYLYRNVTQLYVTVIFVITALVTRLDVPTPQPRHLVLTVVWNVE